jgi:hypothetical protein
MVWFGCLPNVVGVRVGRETSGMRLTSKLQTKMKPESDDLPLDDISINLTSIHIIYSTTQ